MCPLFLLLLFFFFFKGCFTFTETIRLIRDGEPKTATSTVTQLLSSLLQCCFTFTETIRLIRDGEPKTATSTLTQHLSSDLTPLARS